MTTEPESKDEGRAAPAGAAALPADRQAPFARAAAHLRRVLAKAELFPGLAASRASIEAGIEAVERSRSNLQGSLWILLLGGTGVGKSTLLNALAGREIAPVSVRRPTTTRTTFYAHREASLAPLGDVPAGEGELAAHEIEALRDKVVIDPPDFDSTVDANRRRLMPLLEAADLVITVVDREKYRDHELYGLLARFRGEKSFLFVANKADLGWTEELGEDFLSSLARAGFPGARLLTLSARAALDARLSGTGEVGTGEVGDEAGAFSELERIIAEELDRARIREIKRTNLAGIAAHVVEGVSAALGPDPRGRIERAIERCRGTSDETVKALCERFSRAVLASRGRPRTDALRAYLRGLQLFSFGGVFGLYLAVTERLRSFLGRAWPRPIDAVEARALAESRARSVDGVAVGLLLSNAAAGARAELVSAGVSAEVARARLESGPFPSRPALLAAGRPGLSAHSAVAVAAAGAGEALEDVTRSGLGSGWFSVRNVLYNVVPTLLLLGIPAYAVYVTVWCMWRDAASPFLGTVSDAGVLGAIAILAVCFLESVLVDRAFTRGGARALMDMESRMAARLAAYVREGLLEPCERLAREAGAVLDEVDEARDEIGRDAV